MICVGGPLDGKDIESTAGWLSVPDFKDRVAYVANDGAVLHAFGRHIYRRGWNVQFPLSGHQAFIYEGYEMPVEPR